MTLPDAPSADPTRYTDARPLTFGGLTIAFVSCYACGAALLIDPADKAAGLDTTAVHTDWHAQQEDREERLLAALGAAQQAAAKPQQRKGGAGDAGSATS